MKRSPTAIELFCGCGGMSTGFLDAGISIAAGFDLDRRSVEAYRYNHEYRGSLGSVADISTLSGTDILRSAKLDAVDVVLGGPPCQPFSIVGKRRGREDSRANLIFDYLRLVGELRPSALVFENVPNMAAIENGAILDELTSGLTKLGYGICSSIVTAADYGVAQIRRRLLLIGIRGSSEVTLPPPTHSNTDGKLRAYVTAGEILRDLPDAEDYGKCGIFNHEPTQHTPQMVARFAKLPAGRRERGSFHDRLHPDRPSYTLRAGSGNFTPLRPIHFKYDRVITVRESARIQGFQDTFIWPDWIPRLQQYRQVGNAVPPSLSAAVARHIATEMDWKLRPEKTLGDPSTRASPITLTDAERLALRQSRIRGASLGRRERVGREIVSGPY